MSGELVRSLRSLASLGDGWDGSGAKAPPPGVVSTAIELAGRLLDGGYGHPASACATPAGTILFAWYEGAAYAEMEVISPASIEWTVMDHNDVTTHGSLSPRDDGMAIPAALGVSAAVRRSG